jgi:alkylation response protein AidB-like acyl-CoA dehydrogenase
MNHTPDAYQDIRDAVRALCAGFPDEYFRKVDEAARLPGSLCRCADQAGWMAALIPQEYGGSGLSMAEASVIMEEINRSGGNSGACHGQMYVMNAIVRSGSEAQKQKLPAAHRLGRVAHPVHGRDRADDRQRHHPAQDDGGEEGRPLGHQRAEGLDLAHPAQRHDDPAGAHHAAGRRAEALRRPELLPGRAEDRRSATA